MVWEGGVIFLLCTGFLGKVGIDPMTLCLQDGHADHLTKSRDHQPIS